MSFPLSFLDISLLFAIVAAMLLATSELLSLHSGKISILLSRKKLNNAAVVFCVLFLITLGIRIVSIFVS
jgi:hypothetical protein